LEQNTAKEQVKIRLILGYSDACAKTLDLARDIVRVTCSVPGVV
jgi:hypothetical protein